MSFADPRVLPDGPTLSATCRAVRTSVAGRVGTLVDGVRAEPDPPILGRPAAVVLAGTAGSYYGKQLAGEAAMAAANGRRVENRIAVR